jgi:uncharacterized protein
MYTEIVLALIFFLSAFTMSFAGFGFAMISVPLLSIFFPVKEAVVIQFPYCMGLFMYQAWHYRKHFCWSPMQPLLLGTVSGLFLGTFFLYYMPETILKRMLALFIVLIVIFNLISARHKIEVQSFKSPWFGRICGFISGSFLGAYNLGGPPVVMYFRTITNNSLKAKSYMAAFFSILFMVIAVVYGVTGMFTLESLRTTLLYLPSVLLGSATGFWVFHRASNSVYNMVIDMALLLISVVLWINV